METLKWTDTRDKSDKPLRLESKNNKDVRI